MQACTGQHLASTNKAGSMQSCAQTPCEIAHMVAAAASMYAAARTVVTALKECLRA